MDEERGNTKLETQLIGRTIGGFRIEELIGRGGMGLVFRARDAQLDRDVALKILNPAMAADPEFVDRFVREARMVARLDHPNIVQVHTAGRTDDFLFIAMQLAPGRTVEQVLADRGLLPEAEALDVVRQVAEALVPAHRDGVIHRDIKPTNIMVDPQGRVKLMDFGLARSCLRQGKLTVSGIYLGTPEYSSPEQCETNDLDARTDVYSLGVVLYEMLSGSIPHAAETPLALFRKIADEDPTPIRELNPKVSAAAAEIVHTMIARRREDRYQSASELLDALRGVRRRRPQAAGTSRRAIVMSALVGLVALGALIMTLALPNKTPPPATPAPVVTPAPAPAPVLAKLKLSIFDFVNKTGRPEDAWMEYGLSDLLAKTIAPTPWLETALRLDLEAKLRELGLGGAPGEANREALLEALKPDLFVNGDYYVAGNEVRVTVVAYRRGSASRLFLETYAKPKDQFFALITEAAAALAGRFKEEAAREDVVSEKARTKIGDAELGLLSCAQTAQTFMPVLEEAAENRPAADKRKDANRELFDRRGKALNNWDLSRLYFGAQKAVQSAEGHAGGVQVLDEVCKNAAGEDMVLALEVLSEKSAGKGEMESLFTFACPKCERAVDQKKGKCDDCRELGRWGLRRNVVMMLRKLETPVEQKKEGEDY